MRSNRLKYAKYIILKMGFDKALQLKEYSKAIKMLNSEEVSALRNWYYSQVLKQVRKV